MPYPKFLRIKESENRTIVFDMENIHSVVLMKDIRNIRIYQNCGSNFIDMVLPSDNEFLSARDSIINQISSATVEK